MLLRLLLAASLLLLTGADPIVNTSYGTVRGQAVATGERFLGIPFARPPTGSLRWQPPQPPSSWKGVREAVVFGPDCPSTKSDYTRYVQSEDCLYLNVYRPKNVTAESQLPVLLWLYGGSWEYGGSSFFVYNGDSIVQFAQVIVVTTNYRLGLFGFLGSKELAQRTAGGSTGNYGLQDQRAAMVWVQDNIAAFGGDPTRVFLFGESAGSGSVSTHLVLPRSANLFRYAGMESGPPCDWTSRPLNVTQRNYDRIVAATNCSAAADTVACLLTKSTKDMISVEDDTSSQLLLYSPVVDGVELLDDPQALWQAGKINPVSAALLGTNSDEGTIFLKIPHNETADGYTSFVLQQYGQNLGSQILQLYPPANYSAPWWAANAIFTDSLMACPSRRAARWLAAKDTPVYLYQYVHELEALKLGRPYDGVAHASEVPMVFHATELLWTAPERALSKQFISYWTSFAAVGNPNGHGSTPAPAWPAFDPASGAYMQLDLLPSAQSHLKDTVCDFWDRVLAAGCHVSGCPCSCPSL